MRKIRSTRSTDFEAHRSTRDARAEIPRFPLHRSSAGHQIEDRYYQCDHQQKMDQRSGNMEAPSQQPKHQQNGENCPQHLVHSSNGIAPKRTTAWKDPASAKLAIGKEKLLRQNNAQPDHMAALECKAKTQDEKSHREILALIDVFKPRTDVAGKLTHRSQPLDSFRRHFRRAHGQLSNSKIPVTVSRMSLRS